MNEKMQDKIVKLMSKIRPLRFEEPSFENKEKCEKQWNLLIETYDLLRETAFQNLISELKPVEIEESDFLKDGLFTKKGILVKIRPCGDEYKDKTFLGFYLGDMATALGVKTDGDNFRAYAAGHNPAIFVPKLGKVIFGYESWWGEIKSKEELSDITDEDIENVWYVKLLKEQLSKQSKT